MTTEASKIADDAGSSASAVMDDDTDVRANPPAELPDNPDDPVERELRDAAGRFASPEAIAKREMETFNQVAAANGLKPVAIPAEKPKAPDKADAAKEPEKDPAAPPVKDETAGDAASADAAAKTETYKRALRRDGWEQADIDAIPAEKLEKIGAHRLKVQGDIDRKFSEAANRKVGGAHSTEADPTGKPAEPGARTRRAVVDEDAPAAQANDGLDELLDELIEPEKAQQIKDRITRAQTVAAEANARAFTARCQNIAQGLSKEFPKLAGDPPPELLEEMQSLIRTGDYKLSDDTSLKSLITKAAHIVFGPEVKQQIQRAAIQRNAEQRQGQPQVATVLKGPSRPATPEEHERMSYDALIEAKGDLNQARAILSRKLAER